MIILNRLTDTHLESWDKDGFLILKSEKIYTPDVVHDVVGWVGEVQSLPETPGKWMMYFEKSLKDGSRILNRVENFFPYHKKLNDLFNGEWMLGLVAQLFGEEALLFKEKINFKLPGGDGFKPHQDAQARWDRYGHTEHISVAVSIDEATAENGYLEIVAGEHRKGLIGPLDKEIPNDVVEKLEWMPVPTKPGDIVLFGSYVPHRSGPNLTDSTRRLIYLTFNKLSEGDYREQYYADKRKSYPPDIEREPGKKYEYKI